MELFRDEALRSAEDGSPTLHGRSAQRIRVHSTGANGEQTIEGTDPSWAAADPKTQAISADLAGVELDSRGYVKVNDRLETSRPVWAMVTVPAAHSLLTWPSMTPSRPCNLNGGNRTTATD